MWPYSWTHVGTPSHLGHMDRVAATMPYQAHARAAQEAPNIGQWEGQEVPLIRPSSCIVKGGIPSSRRYLPTYLRVEGVRPRKSCGFRWRWGGAGPSVVVCPSWVWVAAPAVVPSSSMPRSPLLSLPGPWVVSCPHLVSLPVPCPYGCLPLRAPLPECPLLPLALPMPMPFPFPVRWWRGGGGAPMAQALGVGGLEPLAEGLGGVGGGGGPGPRRGRGPPMPLAA